MIFMVGFGSHAAYIGKHNLGTGEEMMIVCMVKYMIVFDDQWQAERIADVMFTKLSAFEGFVGYKFLEQPDQGEYVNLVVWESREQALAAHKEVKDFVPELLGYQCYPQIELFDVYQPKKLGEA